MADFLDDFIRNLLHLEDGKSNKLIDLGDMARESVSRSNEKTYLLSVSGRQGGELMLQTVRARRGRSSNQTVLNNSSVVAAVVGTGLKWDWQDLNGVTSVENLHKFIQDAYSELNLKGNNPLFLSVGSIAWNVVISDKLTRVTSPLLIFPIRLVRGSATSPVEIDFVDDEAYFNPCFISLLRDLHPDIASKFPHPNGRDADFDDALDLDVLSDGNGYFDQVESYIAASIANQETSFVLNRNTVAISLYNHSDICMYYDVRRNRDKIYQNKLIAKIFGLKGAEDDVAPKAAPTGDLRFVLPKDSVQEKLIARVAGGESLVIKGPPGTGKTLTIANMIAVLLAQGKRVMFASKKLSALSEVNNKLPENLRKFVMMLAYETEKQAAKFNPSTIRDDFRAMLRYKGAYSRDKSLLTKLNAAMRSKADAMLNLLTYFNTVFGNATVAGKSYYDALDTYYQYSELPTVDFANAKDIEKVSPEQLQRAKDLATEAGKHFAKMCGSSPAKLSPWLNVKQDESVLYAIYGEICKALTNIFAALQQLQDEQGVSLDELPIGILTELAGQAIFDADAIDRIAALANDEEIFDTVDNALTQYRSKLQYATSCVSFTDQAKDSLKDLLTVEMDGQLSVAQLNKLYLNRDKFYKDGKLTVDAVALDKLVEAVDKVSELKASARKSQLEAITVFDKQLTDKQTKQILKAYEVLKDYQGGKATFKATHAAKKLSELSSDPIVRFDSIVKATVEYHNYYRSQNDAATFMRLVSAIVGSISEDEYDALALTLNRSRELGVSPQKYLSQVVEVCELLHKGEGSLQVSDSATLVQLQRAYELHLMKDALLSAIEKCCVNANVERPDADLEKVAEQLVAALRLGKYPQVANASEVEKKRLIQALVSVNHKTLEQLNLVIAKFNEIKQNHVVNYYTANPQELTLVDLKTFATLALDRGALGAAIRYYEIVEELNGLMPVTKLFDALERGAVNVEPKLFAQLLEHSFLKLAIDHTIAQLGSMRNGMGNNAALELEKFDRAEKAIQQLNAKLIEQVCLDKINPDDPDYGFLANDRGAKLTMRGLFKTYAQAIWKLKRCFILSPSTASVLFRPEIYNDFDVVIVDEASQLEPVYLLPILVRSKQCVLVGDEHQMPPISHFKAKNNKLIEDYDRELVLDKDISALSLTLVNQAFDAAELTCHYRSNTESLIAFSQRAFYPYMRTFPAALPFAQGLGFVDVYVNNGRCDGGINLAEVGKTVELIRAHFDKYFDDKAGRLTDGGSIGVVAFGESQLGAIVKQVEADEQLFTKISRARDAVDVGDKAVFFRTIESVQGQETDHLILSLTYGKDKNGKVQNRFGELNRDDFGKCIFNVAVTRAKNSVTLVRSVEPYELDSNTRIGFIVEYMRLVKQFAENGRNQFVSNKLTRGAHFVDDVASYIRSLGVADERIVIGYGVTDGSVRIPIAVLSKDLQSAVLGVWCELPTEKNYDFFDYNLRYYNSLVERNWDLHRVSIHEWYDNNEAEKMLLNNKIQHII